MAVALALTAKPHAKEIKELLKNLVFQPALARWVQWSAPVHGWCKINIDGAYRKSSSLASTGGILRNDSGNW